MPKRRWWGDYSSDSSGSGKLSRSHKPLKIDDRNVPEKVLSNLHCRMCDSHMNSQHMWDQHITGKRHIKNLKKGPDETPSKVKSVPCKVTPKVQDKLDALKEPVVGLDYICETRRADPSIDPFYRCLLCQGTFTVLTISDHLISQKHRISYLKKQYRNFHLIDTSQLNKGQFLYLIERKAAEMEALLGRGTMTVKIEKNKGQLPLSYLPLLFPPKIEAGVRSSHDRIPSPAPSITASVPPARSSWLKDVVSSSKSSHSRNYRSKTSTTKVYGLPSEPSRLRDAASRGSASSEPSSSRDPFLSKPSTLRDSFLSKASTSRDPFLSKPSTSKDSTVSALKDLPWSKASTSKISPAAHVPPPPRVLAPKEIDFDIERDAKYLTGEQKRAILGVVEKNAMENPELFSKDPRELDVLQEYLRVVIGQNLVRKIKNSTPEQKKIIYKNLCTDHPQRVRMSEFKRHSVI